MTSYAGARTFALCLGLKPQEKVLILSDSAARYGEALGILAGGLRQSGAEVSVAFSLPGKLAGDIPRALHAGIIKSDVVVLCGSQSWYQAPLRRRLKYTFKKRVVESYDLKKEMLASGALCADHRALDVVNRKIAARLRGKRRIRVSADNGTDMRALIRDVGSESGAYQLPGSGGNLPAGEVWIGVQPGSACGSIRFNVSFDSLGSLRNGHLTFVCSGGRVQRIGGRKSAAFRAIVAAHPSVRSLAEIAVGTNPAALIGRNVLEDEKKLGMIHCGFGNNTYFGGRTTGPHLDGVLAGATLEADGEILLRSGKVMV